MAAMESDIIRVRTGSREAVADITRQCAEFARSAAKGGDGLLHVFVPHATAGIAIIELGSGSDPDLLSALAALLPADDRWQHAHDRAGTAGPTSCRPSCRRTRRSRCSAAGSRSEPGSPWRLST